MPGNGKDDGRTKRWAAHRDQRRAELVLAAVRAIDRHGPDASIADIAAEAGVSKPVLYRYFADKDELHVAVGQWGAREVLARMVPALGSDAPMRERIAEATDAYLATLEEHPQVFLLLVRHRGADALADGKAEIAPRSPGSSGTPCAISGSMPPVRSRGPTASSAWACRPVNGGSSGAPCRGPRSPTT